MFSFFQDVCVNYNPATKEITCEGIKITDIRNGHLELPIINSAVVNLQEEIFIQFNHSHCKVMFYLTTYRKFNYKI